MAAFMVGANIRFNCFVVVLSGTLFVFCDEIIDFVAGSDKYIEYREGQQKIDADVLIAQFNAKHKEEGRKAFYIDEYKDPERSFRIASGIKEADFHILILILIPETK